MTMGSVCSSADAIGQPGSDGAGAVTKSPARITPDITITNNTVSGLPILDTSHSGATPHIDDSLQTEDDRETGEHDASTVVESIEPAEDQSKSQNKLQLKDIDTNPLFGSGDLDIDRNTNRVPSRKSISTTENSESSEEDSESSEDDSESSEDDSDSSDTGASVDGPFCDSGVDEHDDDYYLRRKRRRLKMGSFGELAITKPAPDFECNAVVKGSFETVKLSSYRGKYVVLFFYPLDFTFVCPTEIIAFSDRAEEFRAINCEIMACSTDSVYSHLAWIDTPRKQGGLGPMKIPLLADRTQEISKKYGCLKPDEGIAFRALYIIDDKGNLRQITMNDLPVGRSVDETLRLVQAFQFTDKHGEVCPAGWKPGKETMKPDPKESQKYFNQVSK